MDTHRPLLLCLLILAAACDLLPTRVAEGERCNTLHFGCAQCVDGVLMECDPGDEKYHAVPCRGPRGCYATGSMEGETCHSCDQSGNRQGDACRTWLPPPSPFCSADETLLLQCTNGRIQETVCPQGWCASIPWNSNCPDVAPDSRWDVLFRSVEFEASVPAPAGDLSACWYEEATGYIACTPWARTADAAQWNAFVRLDITARELVDEDRVVLALWTLDGSGEAVGLGVTRCGLPVLPSLRRPDHARALYVPETSNRMGTIHLQVTAAR
ncbi:MAG: hypothetical protein HY904_16590 [Deltaproteobacteria bacterium]|nr:hypothetical protein [Deltaproteobacteria bacterium]